MFYDTLSIVTGVLGLLALLVGLRVLFRRGWIAGFVRGLGGCCLIGLAGATALIALDLRSYQQMVRDQSIATVSFEQVDEQSFIAILVEARSGFSREFLLKGEQWQLDARVIRWRGPFRAIGGKPGYRLDRISGRYLALEDERFRDRTVYSLERSEYGLDTWVWLNQSQDVVPWIEASYGSATYVPMVDGGLFEVALSNSGLVAKPLNDAAVKAVNYWQ